MSSRARHAQPALCPTVSPVEDPVAEHVRRVLEAPFLADQARLAKIEEIRRAGGRVVEGGPGPAGAWQLRDAHTGAVLARGIGGEAGFRIAVERLSADGVLYHVDRLYEEILTPDPVTPGVPPSLRRLVEDWICHPETPDEEIAAFVGWPVDRVRESR